MKGALHRWENHELVLSHAIEKQPHSLRSAAHYSVRKPCITKINHNITFSHQCNWTLTRWLYQQKHASQLLHESLLYTIGLLTFSAAMFTDCLGLIKWKSNCSSHNITNWILLTYWYESFFKVPCVSVLHSWGVLWKSLSSASLYLQDIGVRGLRLLYARHF